MQLTQESFEKGIGSLLDSIAGIQDKIAEIQKDMVTKTDLKTQLEAQSKELKQYTTDAFEIQQVWMEERFKELIVKYDVRERVEKLEKDVAHLKLARTAHA